MNSGEWERRIKAIEAVVRRRPRALIPIDGPEENLDEYRLPQWVQDRLATIELGRPGGLGSEPEDTRAWVERLTRHALGDNRGSAEK
jgi:hypothetical protein